LLSCTNGANEDLEKRKTRVVAKGFVQRPGVDFTKFFAPIARLEFVRLIIAAAGDMSVEQIDIMMLT